jgi:feruloyl esterase
LKDDATRLSPAKLSALNKGALAACDAGDGVIDGLISNPLACKFDPGTLLCRGGSLDPPEADSCLTARQVDAAKKIYAYSINPRTKEKIFAGMAPGSEMTWTAMAGGPNPFAIPVEFYKYFVYENPDWDWKTFDFDKDVKYADEKFAKLLNAVDPDLSRFAKRGPPSPGGSGATSGKLIMYHGWNDQLIQPYNSIDYFTSVQKKMGTRDTDPPSRGRSGGTSDFARLFMVPGMQHCAGGVGPNTFDAVTALEQWVEKGTKPTQLTASHMSNGVVDRMRPLCPYPQVASYTGVGSIDEVASFVCK